MSNPTRRRLLQAAAVGTAAALGATTHAGEPPVSADQALTAIVRLRFKHLTEDQIKNVQRGIQNNLATAGVLRNIVLTPLDEPATVFIADVAE